MKIALLLVALAAAPAWAQSTRYPAKPVDPDAIAEAHSVLWEQALHPGEHAYEALVGSARDLARDPSRDATDAHTAIASLDRAIALAPDRPDAWALRGQLHGDLATAADAAGEDAHAEWTACADDLAAAEARIEAHPRAAAAEAPADRVSGAKQLANCEGHAGRYAAAEATLVRALAGATDQPELLVRLGAVRIAMGKLEEAVATLDAALEDDDAGGDTAKLARWLLALAYDRERRPSEADQLLDQMVGLDSDLGVLDASSAVLVAPADRDYLYGLAYARLSAATKALLYFRHFAHAVPHSPWRERAEEHVRALSAIELPQSLERRGGYAPIDVLAARAIVHRAMPAMRACLADEPDTLLEVVVTKVGPRTPATALDRPHYHLPPAGAKSHVLLELGDTGAANLPAAQRCVEQLAARIALPTPTERDAYYQLAFPVVGR